MWTWLTETPILVSTRRTKTDVENISKHYHSATYKKEIFWVLDTNHLKKIPWKWVINYICLGTFCNCPFQETEKKNKNNIKRKKKEKRNKKKKKRKEKGEFKTVEGGHGRNTYKSSKAGRLLNELNITWRALGFCFMRTLERKKTSVKV